MTLPKRKNNRLKGYDYSSAGAYFLTVCTFNRKCLLSDIVLNTDFLPAEFLKNPPSDYVGAIHESPECKPEFIYEAAESKLKSYGIIAEKVIEDAGKKYDVEISDYVIMPNHIHLVVFIDEKRAIRESPLQKRSLISKFVGYMKSSVSERIHEFSPEKEIWQRGYHDHIIRNDEEYLKIAEYIHTNPGKWKEDRYFTHSPQL